MKKPFITALYVARYYIGQRFVFVDKNGDNITDIINVISDTNEIFGLGGVDWYPDYYNPKSFKLVLKHHSDMPKKERTEYKNLCHRIFSKQDNVLYIADTPTSLDYLFTKGYDAFDLIENGQAIDAVEYQKVSHLYKDYAKF